MNKQMKISGLQLHIFRIIETSHYPPLKILKNYSRKNLKQYCHAFLINKKPKGFLIPAVKM